MRWLLTATALLAWYVGAMMLLAPARHYAPTGIVMTPLVAMVVRAHGATWLGFGTVNWLARRGDRRHVASILIGNVVIHVGAVAAVLPARAVLPLAAFVFDVASHAVFAIVLTIVLATLLRRER